VEKKDAMSFFDLVISRRRDRFRGAFVIAFTVILVLVLAEVFSYFISKFLDAALPVSLNWGIVLSFLLLTGLVLWAFLAWQYPRIQRQIRAKAYWIDAADLPERPYLICGYSPGAFKNHETGMMEGPALRENWGDYPTDLDQACDRSQGAVLKSWQQNIRVIRRIKGLKHVWVIENSTGQFEAFQHCMSHFFPGVTFSLLTDPKTKTPAIRTSDGGAITPDYENFDYVTRSFDNAFGAICKDCDCSQREVHKMTLIDITGGQKTFSVAAAIASLNRDLIFVYAGTFGKEGQIFGYDASIQIAAKAMEI